MRRATSDTAFKTVCRDRWMHRAARLRVNQGESEGVYDCTPMRDNLSSYVCKKIVKKVDNQQKMIQKGVLLSCSSSYERQFVKLCLQKNR